MGFSELKEKLSGQEEGYPITGDSIYEWINMNPEQKKALIAEAKEKGGVWRESLLELDKSAKNAIHEAEMYTDPKNVPSRKAGEFAGYQKAEKEAAGRLALDKEGQTLRRAADQSAKGAGRKLSKPGDLRYSEDTGGTKSVGKMVKDEISDLPTAAKVGIPAAAAAGLGALALAKKMRAAKKK